MPEQPPSPLDVVKAIIGQAKAEIEAEYQRSPDNAWILCFGSALTTVKMQIQFTRTNFTAEEYETIWQRLRLLEQKFIQLRREHSSRENDVGLAEQEVLLQQLDGILG